MNGSIVIEIDESPLRLTPPTDADYGSRQIVSALYRPLLRLTRAGELAPAVAERYSCSTDCLSWELTIDGGARWSDGARITAEDALDGIVAASGHPLWSRYLRCLRRISAPSPERLSIELVHPFHPLPYLLTLPDLAPRPRAELRPDLVDRFSGPYMLRSSAADAYGLVPNPAFPAAADRLALTFVKNRRPEMSPEAFANGRVDLTAHTGFPLGQLPVMRSHPAYRTQATGILMQLEINPRGADWLRDRGARHALHTAIDRDAIARDLWDGVRPAISFGANGLFPGGELALPPASGSPHGDRPSTSRPLRVLYNDYSPNRAVLAAVLAQWRSVLDIDAEAISVEFSDVQRDDFDLLLALRFPTFPSAWAVVEHLTLLAMSLDDPCAAIMNDRLGDWLQGPAGMPLPLPPIGAALREGLPVIPLVEITGHWLQRESVPPVLRYPENAYFCYEAESI